jgi:hypothetical protein
MQVPLSEHTFPLAQPTVGLHSAWQVWLTHPRPTSHEALSVHILPHCTPYASEHANEAPLDPPQLEAAHAARRVAPAICATAMNIRAIDLALER